MDKQKPIMWIEREDFCPHCKSRKSLMLYDSNNRIVNYPMILDQHREDVFQMNENMKQYKYFQCNKCGTYFFIDWSNGLPRAMHSSFYKSFITNYKMLKMI